MQTLTIQVFDEINDRMFRDVTDQLGDCPGAYELRIEVDSDGGFVDSGDKIINAINEYRALSVVTFNRGRAASAAATVFLAGTRRIAHPDSVVMIHCTTRGGDRNALATRARSAHTAEFVAKRTGNSVEQVRIWMEREVYFSSGAARSGGFATEINMQPKLRTKIDIAKYNQPLPSSEALLATERGVMQSEWRVNRAERLKYREQRQSARY